MKKMKMRTLARNGRFSSAANTLRSHRRGGYYPPEHLRFFGIFEKKGAVQKQLHIVCDYLGYEGISTHSFPQVVRNGNLKCKRL